MRTSRHVDNLLKAVKSCGVSTSIWKNKGGDYDWTSLMGADKKKLLHELPTKFEEFLDVEEAQKTKQLWQVLIIV